MSDPTPAATPASDEADIARIALPARFDLRAAPEVLDKLRAASGKATLDAAEVDVLTSPALQILLAASRSDACKLQIEAPSRAFLDCLAMLGTSVDDLCGAEAAT